MELLQHVKAGTITEAEAAKQIAAAQTGEFRLKVTEKGCVGMRGIPGTNSKFGLSLYVSAVEFLLDHADELRAWIKENNSSLSRK